MDYKKLNDALKLFGETLMNTAQEVSHLLQAEVYPPILFSEFLKEEGYIGIPEQIEIALTPTFVYYDLPAYRMFEGLMKVHNLVKEKGIMLFGLPGTGKTFFARSLAKYLRQQMGESIIINQISATNLLKEHVGETEFAIRNLFRIYKANTFNLVIIDEFDGISRSRSLAKNNWEVTFVNQLLYCMDGLNDNSKTLVIGMTNNLQMIDPAFLRTGRFGSIIEMPLPTQEDRQKLFQLHCSHLADQNMLASDVDYQVLASITPDFSGAGIRGIVEKTNRVVFERSFRLLKEKIVSIESLQENPNKICMKDFSLEVLKIQKANLALKNKRKEFEKAHSKL